MPTTATLPPTQIWEAEDSRPAVTTVSELGRTGQAQPAPLPRDKVETANKANKDEDEEEEDTQKTQQEDIATQVAAEDPWVQEKI